MSTCANPGCNEIGTKACANCKAKYCSKECQKMDWKEHKKICANTSLQNTIIPPPSTAPVEDKDLCYRQLSLEEEFVRATDSFKALSDFYFDVDKDRRRDRVGELQNRARQGIFDPNAIAKLTDELKRQYYECLTVEPNDSGASLMHKNIIFGVVQGLLQQTNVPMLPPAVLGSKKEALNNHTRDKMKRMNALTEAIRLKHHPQSSSMSGSQMDTICREILTKWAKAKRTTGPSAGGKVPEKKCPWYAGPPGWIFPTGYASLVDKSSNFRMMCSLLFTQRIADHKHRFYVYNYPAGYYGLMGYDATPLTFEEHRRYHTLAGAAVVISAEAEATLASISDRLMSVQEFGSLGNIDENLVAMYTKTCGTMEAVKKNNAAGGSGITVCLPHVVVGSCDGCGKPAVGECVCGECYCSVRLC